MNTDKRRSGIPEAAAGPSACMALSCGILSAGPMDARLVNVLSCGVASAAVSDAMLSACSLDVRCGAAASAALSGCCGLSSGAAPSSGMSAASMGLLTRACSRGGLWLDGGRRFAATVMLACALQMAVRPAWGDINVPPDTASVTLTNYDQMNVYNGGTAISTTIKNNGRQNVSKGGTASVTFISDGGHQFVNSGGTAIDTTISNGGVQQVNFGGKASATSIFDGHQEVLSGGTASNTTINGGTFKIKDGGKATGKLEGHGKVIGALIVDGSENLSLLNVSGSMNVSADIDIIVLPDSSTNTSSYGGEIIVSGGGSVHISSDGTLNVSAVSSGSLSHGGVMTVSDRGSVHLSSGGTLKVEHDVSISGGSLIMDDDASLSAGKLVAQGSADISATSITTSSGTFVSGGTVSAGTISGILTASGGSANATTVNGDVNVYGGMVSAGTIRDNLTAFGGSANATTVNGDVNVYGGTVSAGAIGGTLTASGGTVSANTVTHDVNAYGGTVSATSVDGCVNVINGSVTADTVSSDAVVSGGALMAGTINGSLTATGGTVIATSSLNGDITVNGGTVAAADVDLKKAIAVSSGALTIGSTVAAPLPAGASAGIFFDEKKDISRSPGITVGADAAAPGSGGLSLGSKTVLGVNAGSVAAPGEAVLTAENIFISDNNAVLSVSGITTAKSFTAYEATEGSSGSFAAVVTDSLLFDGAINPDGTVTLREASAARFMTELDPGLVGILDNAARNGEIGTDDAHIFSNQGGTRFLSRIISREYGGADPKQAERTLESATRGAIVGAVPQMAMAAANAGAGAVAGRLLPSASGGGVLAVSLDGGAPTGLAAGDEPAGGRTGLALWLMPLYRNWSGFGLKGGNYDMDVRGALGGLALGADYTFANAIRLGITFNLGGGYAEGSGDFNSTTNSMTFWGVGLYGGWMPGDFSLTADVNYTSIRNRLRQELPAAMQMADLSADITSWALSVGLRAGYTFRTEWLDVIPHAGVRFTHLKVNGYELESGGLPVLEGDAIRQNIWSFPLGVTFAKSIALNNGWHVKPSLDLRVTPNAGDIKSRGDVRFTGVGGSTTMETQTMDHLTWGGTAGLEFGKDNLKLGLNYDLEAGARSTQHGLFATFRYEF